MIKELKFKEKVKETKSTNSVAVFISYLQTCTTVIKRMHWSTTSYSQHKSLDKCFDGLLDIVDSIAEKSSGYLNSHLTDFEDFPAKLHQSKDPHSYLTEVKEYIQKDRYVHFPKEYTPIQNEIDSLVNLIDNTLYLLTLK